MHSPYSVWCRRNSEPLLRFRTLVASLQWLANQGSRYQYRGSLHLNSYAVSNVLAGWVVRSPRRRQLMRTGCRTTQKHSTSRCSSLQSQTDCFRVLTAYSSPALKLTLNSSHAKNHDLGGVPHAHNSGAGASCRSTSTRVVAT